MARYQLHLRIGNNWKLFHTIDAPDHPTALRQAIACLGPENYDKQLRLEQVGTLDKKPSTASPTKRGKSTVPAAAHE